MTESQPTPPDEGKQQPTPYPQMPEFAAAGPSGPPPAPPNDLNLVARLLYVMAGLGVINVVLTFAMRSDIEDAVIDRSPDLTPDEVDSAVNFILVVGVILGLVFAAVYLLLARKILQGAGWARIVATILLALAILGGITSGGQAIPAVGVVLSVISAVVAVVTLFLLWRRPASDYFSEMAVHRRR